MDKLSNAQLEQMMKLAATGLRSMSEKLAEANSKLAQYEKKDRAVKIATQMESKGLNSDLSFEEKVAHLLGQEDLDVVEKAVGMSVSNMKTFSLTDKVASVGDGSGDTDSLMDEFAQNLASIDS